MRKAADITGRARQRLYERRDQAGDDGARDGAGAQAADAGGGRRRDLLRPHPGQSARPQEPVPYDRPLERGMVIGMDCGAWYGMYTVDYPALRGPRQGHGRAAARPRGGQVRQPADGRSDPAGGALAPRSTVSAVEACKDVDVELDEMPQAAGVRMGHGQGMLLTEPPSISERRPHRAGARHGAEHGAGGERWRRRGNVEYLWEDTHVVTEDGHEQLTWRSMSCGRSRPREPSAWPIRRGGPGACAPRWASPLGRRKQPPGASLYPVR